MLRSCARHIRLSCQDHFDDFRFSFDMVSSLCSQTNTQGLLKQLSIFTSKSSGTHDELSDPEVVEHCGGHVKVIASIEDPTVIAYIRSAGPAPAPEEKSREHRYYKALYVTARARTTSS